MDDAPAFLPAEVAQSDYRCEVEEKFADKFRPDPLKAYVAKQADAIPLDRAFIIDVCNTNTQLSLFPAERRDVQFHSARTGWASKIASDNM
jgi:hypothetical protein